MDLAHPQGEASAVADSQARPIVRTAGGSQGGGGDGALERARAEAAIAREFATPSPELCDVLFENQAMVRSSQPFRATTHIAWFRLYSSALAPGSNAVEYTRAGCRQQTCRPLL